MLVRQPSNILEIDEVVKKFLQKYREGISTIHQIYFHTNNQLSLQIFATELIDELRTGCAAFFNKNFSVEELDSYLFYIVNDFAKKRVSYFKDNSKIEYLCPGCLFLGINFTIAHDGNIFKCDSCILEMKSVTDPKKELLFKVFSKHNKQGYRCQDCDRFIPHPLDESTVVSCPYFDCCFVGHWRKLKKMRHPWIQRDPVKFIIEEECSLNNTLDDKQIDAHSDLEVKENIRHKIKILHDVIDALYHSVPYSSADFTAKHKMFCYQAFSNILKIYPIEIVNYLLNSSRSGGFQHKIFQEYIRLLEKSLPLMFKKNKKIYKIESLLDDNLSIFDGISSFQSIMTDKGIIKNGTTEFYIGGRKAYITKPYYIGKLLNIVDINTKKSLIDHVLEYSFSVIKTHDIAPKTQVMVTHLRIPPHYQMGGMSHVNRVRKKIVDRARALIQGE